jgi:hypothetical protein
VAVASCSLRVAAICSSEQRDLRKDERPRDWEFAAVF